MKEATTKKHSDPLTTFGAGRSKNNSSPRKQNSPSRPAPQYILVARGGVVEHITVIDGGEPQEFIVLYQDYDMYLEELRSRRDSPSIQVLQQYRSVPQ